MDNAHENCDTNFNGKFLFYFILINDNVIFTKLTNL